MSTKICFCIFILAFLPMGCGKIDTNSEEKVLGSLLEEWLEDHEIDDFSGTLIAVSSSNCRNCAESIIQVASQVRGVILAYDFKTINITPTSEYKCRYINDDFPARLIVNRHGGHKLFYFKHSKLKGSKAITANNVDSLNYFIE